MSETLNRIYKRIDNSSTPAGAPKLGEFNGDGVKIVSNNFYVENAETFAYDLTQSCPITIYQGIDVSQDGNSTIGSDYYDTSSYYYRINRNVALSGLYLGTDASLTIESIAIGEYKTNYSTSATTIYLESEILHVLGVSYNTTLDNSPINDLEISYTVSNNVSKYTMTGVINEVNASQNDTRTSFFALPGYTLEYKEINEAPGVNFCKDPSDNKITITMSELIERNGGSNGTN